MLRTAGIVAAGSSHTEGVIVHVEMQMGTASAGPIAADVGLAYDYRLVELTDARDPFDVEPEDQDLQISSVVPSFSTVSVSMKLV